jgi:hypothetical protein
MPGTTISAEASIPSDREYLQMLYKDKPFQREISDHQTHLVNDEEYRFRVTDMLAGNIWTAAFLLFPEKCDKRMFWVESYSLKGDMSDNLLSGLMDESGVFLFILKDKKKEMTETGYTGNLKRSIQALKDCGIPILVFSRKHFLMIEGGVISPIMKMSPLIYVKGACAYAASEAIKPPKCIPRKIEVLMSKPKKRRRT